MGSLLLATPRRLARLCGLGLASVLSAEQVVRMAAAAGSARVTKADKELLEEEEVEVAAVLALAEVRVGVVVLMMAVAEVMLVRLAMAQLRHSFSWAGPKVKLKDLVHLPDWELMLGIESLVRCS